MPSSSRSRAGERDVLHGGERRLEGVGVGFHRREGSPLYTLEGTRQHSRCTKRPYAPETISIVPTRTAFFEMKHALFGSPLSASPLPTLHRLFCLRRFFACASSHLERPVAARSTLYMGSPESLNASA